MIDVTHTAWTSSEGCLHACLNRMQCFMTFVFWSVAMPGRQAWASFEALACEHPQHAHRSVLH